MAKKKSNSRVSRVARMVAAFEKVLKAREQKINLTRMPGPKKSVNKKPAAVNPLLKCGRRHEHSWDGWTTVFADRELGLVVNHDDALGAQRRTPDDCVMARVLARSVLGPYITGAEVGTNITKVWSEEAKTEVRFHTSQELGKAIRQWDKTGRWSLPNSMYWLRRYPDSLRPGYRRAGQERARKSAGKKAAPSRTVLRLDNLRRIIAAADKAAKRKKK